MKRPAVGALMVVALGVPGAVQGQSATGTVNAIALVEAVLQVNNFSDVNFGTIVPGTGVTLTPGTTPGAGSLGVLQIQHNSDVQVSATVPDDLMNNGNPLPVTFSCGWSDDAPGALSGGESACTALPVRTGPGDGTTSTSYLQVGGSISAGDTVNRVPGVYTGTLTFIFSAQY